MAKQPEQLELPLKEKTDGQGNYKSKVRGKVSTPETDGVDSGNG